MPELTTLEIRAMQVALRAVMHCSDCRKTLPIQMFYPPSDSHGPYRMCRMCIDSNRTRKRAERAKKRLLRKLLP